MKASEFDFELPPERIAQAPLPERTQARMMVVHRGSGELEHRTVGDLPDYLDPGDLVVVNDTRVIPARLFGQREGTGGRVELLLIEARPEADPDVDGEGGADEGGEGPAHAVVWEAMYRASVKARVGMRLSLAGGRVLGEIVNRTESGRVWVRLSSAEPLLRILEEEGVPPVPPYIKRPDPKGALLALDRERYQTVYADEPGSVAAPTAGLHFSDALIADLDRQGVGRASVTLHVGPGTFKPVKAENVADHVMESERYVLPDTTVARIAEAKGRGGRIVAVGTTTVRTLETVAALHGKLVACAGRSEIFIRPPYTFRAVDVLLTNFHLPRSTLLMLVSAFANTDLVLRAYREAVRMDYRFYSYGDCMLLL